MAEAHELRQRMIRYLLPKMETPDSRASQEKKKTKRGKQPQKPLNTTLYNTHLKNWRHLQKLRLKLRRIYIWARGTARHTEYVPNTKIIKGYVTRTKKKKTLSGKLMRVQDKLKFKYGITHITNCGKQENRHPTHFIYQKFGISPEDPTSLLKPLDDFFAFVTKAAKEKGKCPVSFFRSLTTILGCVLVASEDGAGASLVIGFLMERRKLTFFEAFQHVYKRRYVITIAAGYVYFLFQQQLS